ncbi:uncharacterized protein VDAG_04854 [Verticillium dahliae VdLs.17]|uniref:BZIP domain-containing protein n=1 Tax=Verticillium dahliae (strain VdLs.17 / ATCC MYA-4575 / FGSC 10137) TaxID=498257 RepID=G2X369_VERDV|nr:uncharacterized protein VDAG_04854 [Verticillium dahliae VdLs.17]EGY23416.1 hypothetical protein VDAG_04854 [Verticillium dahliae VdLs.17]
MNHDNLPAFESRGYRQEPTNIPANPFIDSSTIHSYFNPHTVNPAFDPFFASGKIDPFFFPQRMIEQENNPFLHHYNVVPDTTEQTPIVFQSDQVSLHSPTLPTRSNTEGLKRRRGRPILGDPASQDPKDRRRKKIRDAQRNLRDRQTERENKATRELEVEMEGFRGRKAAWYKLEGFPEMEDLRQIDPKLFSDIRGIISRTSTLP